MVFGLTRRTISIPGGGGSSNVDAGVAAIGSRAEELGWRGSR
jgi:hypothetical protein